MRYRRRIFSAIFCLTMALSAGAYDFESEGVYYNILSETTCEITYKEWGESGPSNDLVGSLSIPSSVSYDGKDYAVFQIGEYAYYECSTLTGNLIIPDNIKSIGTRTFYGCNGLSGALEIPASVQTIGLNAFDLCEGITSLKICEPTEGEKGLENIESQTFSSCTHITEIDLPSCIKGIGSRAFNGCVSLKQIICRAEKVPVLSFNSFSGIDDLDDVIIYVPEYSVGAYADEWEIFKTIIPIPEIGKYFRDGDFYYRVLSDSTCSLLKTFVTKGELNFKSTVTDGMSDYTVVKIDAYCFNGLTELTGGLNLPSTLEEIGNGAFWNCSGLTGSLIIPEGVESIGYGAFNGCKSFTGNLILPKNLKAIMDAAFSDCSGLTGSLIIPENLKTISDYAFYGCSGLTGNLIIPEGVESIGYVAFYGCKGLNGALEIPASVQSIGKNAFDLCEGITSLKICEPTKGEKGLENIESQTFSSCTHITEIDLPSCIKSIGSRAFNDCHTLKRIICRAENVPALSINSFAGVNDMGSVILYVPEQSVWAYAFDWEIFETVLPIPEIGKYFRDGDFYYRVLSDSTCSLMKTFVTKGELNFKSTVTDGESDYTVIKIDAYCFNGLTELTGGLNLPSTLEEIGDGAFWNCSGLTGSLIIPEGVESIGHGAFNGCSGLTGSLIIPEGVESIGNAAFDGCKGFTGNLILPENLKTIPDYAFLGCSGLTGNLIIPEGIESIGYAAFDECKGFTGNLILPENLKTIPDFAFYGCSGLTGNLIIPEGVESIGYVAFAGCYGLNGELRIPLAVDSIGSMAFGSCSFESVLFENPQPKESSRELSNSIQGVKKIADNAFLSCSKLTTVDLPETLESIGGGAFAYCALKSVTCRAASVPDLLGDNVFVGTDYSNATLTVPKNSKELYANAEQWKDFTNIEELDPVDTIVKDILDSATSIDSEAEFYDINGQRINSETLSPGIYIRILNGNASKVMIK